MDVNSFTISNEIDPKNARQIMGLDSQILDKLPMFEDGMVIRVDSKQQSAESTKIKVEKTAFIKEAPQQQQQPQQNVSSQQKGSQQVPAQANKNAGQTQENKNAPQTQANKNLPSTQANKSTVPAQGKDQAKQDAAKEEDQQYKRKCQHGPNTKCVNCLSEEGKKIDKDQLKKEEKQLFCQCKPGQPKKCLFCLDSEFIHNIKHIAFDQFIEDQRLKCRGTHPVNITCNHCAPPSEISYKPKLKPGQNKQGLKQLQISDLPPNIVLKQQPYRHIDYVQFQNVPEVQKFVQHWCSLGQAEQRMGWIYGYYAEDPNYKNGVRAVVEAFYEPPQLGDFNSVEEKPDKMEKIVNRVAGSLQLERIGWYYTTISQDDFFVDAGTVRKMARLQEENKVKHPSGHDVSKFITVVFRRGKQNDYEVVPEVYMVSDQCMAMERDNIFDVHEKRGLLKIREPNPEDQTDFVPTAIQNGQPQKQISTAFMLVSIAHGSPSHTRFNILKNYEFPFFNRGNKPIRDDDVTQYLIKNKGKTTHLKYGNFQLLIAIAQFLDIDNAQIIGQAVEQEKTISEDLEFLIKQRFKA